MAVIKQRENLSVNVAVSTQLKVDKHPSLQGRRGKQYNLEHKLLVLQWPIKFLPELWKQGMSCTTFHDCTQASKNESCTTEHHTMSRSANMQQLMHIIPLVRATTPASRFFLRQPSQSSKKRRTKKAHALVTLRSHLLVKNDDVFGFDYGSVSMVLKEVPQSPYSQKQRSSL